MRFILSCITCAIGTGLIGYSLDFQIPKHEIAFLVGCVFIGVTGIIIGEKS